MKRLAVILALVLMCGCARYSNLCNAVYCNPDLTGMTKIELMDEFGDPAFVESKAGGEIYTYEVAPIWRYGAKSKIKVILEGDVVTESSFIPAKDPKAVQ